MNEEEKWSSLVELDEQLLLGGVILSEWATFLIKDADVAFVSGAYLACIITGLAGVETHLRSETDKNWLSFVNLIEESNLEEELKQELHLLRKYRNKWVHVANPWEDDLLINSPELYETELEHMAKRCELALRKTIYSNQFV